MLLSIIFGIYVKNGYKNVIFIFSFEMNAQKYNSRPKWPSSGHFWVVVVVGKPAPFSVIAIFLLFCMYQDCIISLIFPSSFFFVIVLLLA